MQEFVDLGEKFIFLIMLFASILAVAVFIERLLVFRKSISQKAEAYLRDITQPLRDKNVSDATTLTQSQDDMVYSRFMKFSLELTEKKHQGINDLMQGKIIAEKIELEKRLPILNTLGNNAPFIGLLGTVLGVIKAFYGLGTLGNSGAEVVMRSISTALLATAAGLAVAIPVVMANNYFSRKLKVILQNLDILSKEIVGNFFPDSKSH